MLNKARLINNANIVLGDRYRLEIPNDLIMDPNTAG